MILAIDVGYDEHGGALAAGVMFKQWSDVDATTKITLPIRLVADYEPGYFYKRELPCILSLLDALNEEISTIVIDGYVYLGEEKKAGLGKHLWESMAVKVPIIGVAKSYFNGTPDEYALFRGKSTKPLYVSAIGMDLMQAKHCIAQMHGLHRIPSLLTLVDHLSRGLATP